MTKNDYRRATNIIDVIERDFSIGDDERLTPEFEQAYHALKTSILLSKHFHIHDPIFRGTVNNGKNKCGDCDAWYLQTEANSISFSEVK